MTETTVPASPDAGDPLDFRPYLRAIGQGRALSEVEAEIVFTAFMRGEATEIEMAGVLMGLQARGVVAAEIAGGVRALRAGSWARSSA